MEEVFKGAGLYRCERDLHHHLSILFSAVSPMNIGQENALARYEWVTVHESRMTSVQKRMEPRRSLLGASVDHTDARWPDLVRWQFVEGDKTPLELFLGTLVGWDAVLRQRMDNCNLNLDCKFGHRAHGPA